MSPTVRRESKYKQMAFETAVRNPERYLGILRALSNFQEDVLDDEKLLEIVTHLYREGLVGSDEIEDLAAPDIAAQVVEVNRTRNGDGGFPKGYASRFWTYARTLSELGFIYAQYKEPFKFSSIALKLLAGEVDEQEAFSVQAMKYNRRSPYRNVTNDFNFFRLVLQILIALKAQGKRMSFEQFVVVMFNRTGDPAESLEILAQRSFRDMDSVFTFVQEHYEESNQLATVTRDYPDVVRRVLQIAGFITVRYDGRKFVELNEAKLEYIQALLDRDFALSPEAKEDAGTYFSLLATDELLDVAISFRTRDELTGEDYTEKLFAIIATYGLTIEIILKSLAVLETRKDTPIEEFKEIPEPLKLEFYIAVLLALTYGTEFTIKPNYKADHIGKPYAHAPGGRGDIDVYSETTYWLIEVTLIRNRTQMLNSETTNVIRHLLDNPQFAEIPQKYLSFIAPVIHDDVRRFYTHSIVEGTLNNRTAYIKPYSLDEFIKVTSAKRNMHDMESYTANSISEMRDNLNRAMN